MLSAFFHCGDRISYRVERKNQFKRLVKQCDRTKPLIPSRGYRILCVDGKSYAARFCRHGQGSLSGCQQQIAPKSLTLHRTINRQPPKAEYRDVVAAEPFS